MKFYTYVLRSTTFERSYVGFTKDIDSRLKQHNARRTKSTKPFRPWILLFYEEFDSKADAIDREKWLKSGVGREYIKKIMAS